MRRITADDVAAWRKKIIPVVTAELGEYAVDMSRYAAAEAGEEDGGPSWKMVFRGPNGNTIRVTGIEMVGGFLAWNPPVLD